MHIGQAIDVLREGDTIARAGWNGKGIFIKMQMADEHSEMSGDYLYIDTTGLQTDNKAAPKLRVPWLPSQSDLLAKDWEQYYT